VAYSIAFLKKKQTKSFEGEKVIVNCFVFRGHRREEEGTRLSVEKNGARERVVKIKKEGGKKKRKDLPQILLKKEKGSFISRQKKRRAAHEV